MHLVCKEHHSVTLENMVACGLCYQEILKASSMAEHAVSSIHLDKSTGQKQESDAFE